MSIDRGDRDDPAEANREPFEEQVEIIFKAFNSRSLSHHGKYYDIPPTGRCAS